MPSGHGLTFEAAVGSIQETAGGPGQARTAVVTTTFGNACNTTGNWFVAVQSWTGTTKSDNAFMVIIPRN